MHKETVGFWSDVYGFAMSSLRRDVVREPRVCVVAQDCVVTSSVQLCDLDLLTVTTDCLDFSTEFQLVPTKTTEITALVGYFDTFFDLPNPVTFSTGPHSKPTHWKQTAFLLQNPISVKEGWCTQLKTFVLFEFSVNEKRSH